MGLKWILHLLVISSCPLFLQASFGDYPSANLSTSWDSTQVESWLLPDGSSLQPILLNNSNMLDFPAFGCGFYNINTAQGKSTFFVVFAAAVSDNPTYLGYSATILWLANRDNPVNMSAKLEFTSDGDLVLGDANYNVSWSTNTFGKSVVGMRIASLGNLMLYDSYNSIVWQSFDHPTDTWLPGQTLSPHQRLISRVSPTNFSSGLFFLSCSTDGLSAFIEADPPQLYSDALKAPDFPKGFKLGRLEFTRVNSNSTMLYLNKTENFHYLRLESSGHLRVYQWFREAEGFTDVPITSLGYCGYPMICGKYGICSDGRCSCQKVDSSGLSYFREFNSTFLNIGCEEVTQLSCQSSTHHLLLELPNVDYFHFSVDIPHTNIETCKDSCLKNCSCKAAIFRHSYLNISHGDCYLPSQIFSLTNSTSSEYAHSLFIKVQKADASSRNRKKKIALVVGLILAASFLFAFLILYYIRISRKRKFIRERRHGSGEWENSLELLPDLPMRFTYEELTSATDNFGIHKRLGGGGFGSVFEGRLRDGTRVAIKRLQQLGQGRKEFLAEVKTMGNLHHTNLVKLIGFCAGGSNRLLVYEYMSSGSLDRWIFQIATESTLQWNIRKQIILDIAKGLAYLHEDCRKRIAHLDIKPENILLDDNFSAKVSDFGLAKLIEKDQSDVMTQMRGTRGYLAPEWLSGKITEKADVYSFGVVMLEVVCGRKNLDHSQPDESESLIQTLKRKLKQVS